MEMINHTFEYGLPEVMTCAAAVDHFNCTLEDMFHIIRIGNVPTFKTYSNTFFMAEDFMDALREILSECGEIEELVGDSDFSVFRAAYEELYPTKNRDNDVRLHIIAGVVHTFRRGNLADFVKSVAFGWQADLCPCMQERFLLVNERLGWLTSSGKDRLERLKAMNQEKL